MTLYIRLILITLGLAISNYITYQYVDNKWEMKWQEANVESLQLTLEAQQTEMQKQQQLITTQEKQNEIDKKRNQQIESDLANANDSVGMLQQKLRAMSRNQTSTDSTSDIRSAASAASDRLVLSQLLTNCAERYKRMAETADRSRAAGLSCQEQYQSIREVVNE